MPKPKWTLVQYGCRENPGIWDTGEGSVKYVEENPKYPNIERVRIKSYCNRTEDDCVFYRLADQPVRTFDTLRAARRAVVED